MKTIRLVFVSWHENKTWIEGYDMTWKLVRLLHLRVAPGINTLSGTLQFGNLRKASEYSKLNLAKLDGLEAGTVITEISRMMLNIDS